MHLLLTRPIEEARASAVRLEAMGHAVTLAPMLKIVADAQVPIDIAGVSAILVTSPRAIRALAVRDDFLQVVCLPLFAVGERTADVAREAGFSVVESAAGDVAALAGVVAERLDPVNGALLYACGRDRRGDLEGRLGIDGFTVRVVEVYRAQAVRGMPEQARRALEDGRIEGVLIYSARTAEIFLEAVTHAGMRESLSALSVFAISEAAAAPFAETDVERVAVALRPDEASLLDLVVMIH